MFDNLQWLVEAVYGGISPPVGHGVAVDVQGHQVRFGIHLPLVLGDGLDVVDLDVAVRVVLAVGLVEVELAHRTGGSVYLYRDPAVLLAQRSSSLSDA